MIYRRCFRLFLFTILTWNCSFAKDTLLFENLKIDLIESLSDEEKIENLIILTDSLLTSEPEICLTYAKESLKLAEKLENDEYRLTVLIQLAKIYKNETNLVSAMNYAEQAKALSLSLDNKRQYAEALLVSGNIYSFLGDYEKCAEMNFEALKVSNGIRYETAISQALNNIAGVYVKQENFDKALEYYTQALRIARQTNYFEGISSYLNNLAALYIGLGDYIKAESRLLEAAKLNKINRRKLWEAANYNNLGDVYRLTKNYDTAFLYYQRAVAICEEFNFTPYLSTFSISLSEYFSDIGDPGKTLYYAHQALEICKGSDLKNSIYEAVKNLHAQYLLLSDSTNAYKYSLLEQQMKDSLDVEKSMVLLSHLNQLYEFEKKDKEKKLAQQRKNYTYILIGTILFAIFVFVIIILIVGHRNKAKIVIFEKKQLENEIEIKNKELTSNVMSLMRKNEVLSDIAGKLMNIRVSAVKDETKIALKKIVKELQNNKNHEVWTEFDIRFKQVHNEFYDKLIQRYPDLTPTEQRLCAFLRLNMTTKEISELTGQRTGTIEVARTRLRSKLGITHDHSNLVMFLSQI